MKKIDLVAPITQEKIESLIKEESYIKLGKKTTICLLTLHNGMEIVGYSHPLSKAEYKKHVGRKYSRLRALDRLIENLAVIAHNNLIDEV